MPSVNSSPSIDVLVAHDWPSVITEFSAVPLPSLELSNIGSPPVDKIIKEMKPRYIFCSGGGHPPSFWEREPFMWADEADRVSRFVGLGAFGGEQVDGKKQRVRVSLKLGLVCLLTSLAVVLCLHNHSRSSDDGGIPAAC
jgi:hypothetical protein